MATHDGSATEGPYVRMKQKLGDEVSAFLARIGLEPIAHGS